jgi:hypothetical protein
MNSQEIQSLNGYIVKVLVLRGTLQ